MKLKVETLTSEAVVPAYKTQGASGMDLSSVVEITIKPFERVLVPTGLAVEIEHGYEGQLRPRSGTSFKRGLTLINCVGTIDEDYRGEIFVPIVNLDSKPQTIEKGERIAQLVIAPYIQAEIERVAELSDTARGTGGFGSTGK